MMVIYRVVAWGVRWLIIAVTVQRAARHENEKYCTAAWQPQMYTVNRA